MFDESIQFDEEILLVAVQPRVAPLVKFGRQEDSEGAHFIRPARVVYSDRVGERFVLEVSEASKHGAPRLEIHTAGEIDIGLLPESVERICSSGLGLDFDSINCYPGVIQLKFC